MGNKRQPPSVSVTERERPVLPDRMLRVFSAQREAIREHGCRFFEPDPVLRAISLILRRIPLEFHITPSRLTVLGSPAPTAPG